uniref:Uncharacterized protein isoform X2 n=1 Tax=Nicotiana tabacum TaxID=4097 RepID=A0A1S3YKR7_TOBAC|nr:PREDICTED: uncharacterized protein LOC107777166 isoform X2 [Nicotiana tabacum]
MTHRCSHCSTNGHNSRTCPNRGVRLFGVRWTDGLIRKSASMGNLTHFASSSGPLNGDVHDSPGDAPDDPAVGGSADGYVSEGFVAGSSSSHERKKGVPWTEEEHMMFLLGLQKLGKDDINGCIILAKSGLAHHDNYHEFCRLLGCFKVNYQAGILVFRSRKWARVVGLQTQSRDLSQLLRKGFDWMKLMRPLNEEKDHWVPDEAVRKCTACGTDFGAFVRRTDRKILFTE